MNVVAVDTDTIVSCVILVVDNTGLIVGVVVAFIVLIIVVVVVVVVVLRRRRCRPSRFPLSMIRFFLALMKCISDS